jgi:hypothetical protein
MYLYLIAERQLLVSVRNERYLCAKRHATGEIITLAFIEYSPPPLSLSLSLGLSYEMDQEILLSGWRFEPDSPGTEHAK